MSDFYPDNYEVQSGASKYMKLKDGDNKIRIVTKPVVGTECWIDVDGERKAKRLPYGSSLSASEVLVDKFGKASIYPFQAFGVYDYDSKNVEVLMIKQSTIQRGLKALVDDPDWGDPRFYDIVIRRSEEDTRVIYSVSPKPVKKLEEDVKAVIKGSPLDMNKLLSSNASPYGGDPFEIIEVIPAHVLEAKKSFAETRTVKDESIDPDDLPF